MKSAPTLTLISWILFPLVGALAAPPSPENGATSVATAQKSLDAARENLSMAVKRIEKDPPSNPDLDSAHQAVQALKDAIDAGAQFESSDLDYAKTVLAARKELRTQRDYVDQRRANIRIHEQRRTIDRALTEMTAQSKRVAGGTPSPKDFDDARAAIQALKTVVNESRSFGKQDPKFAAYLSETDATIAREEKALDDRWLQLSADKQRGLLEESRRGLSTSMAELAKDGTDAKFESADRAAAALAKRLEDGKVLEGKDKGYRADADKARNQLAASKKRMEELLGESNLARLKAEIEPAHKDLIAAGKAIRIRAPSEDQLAEARTAAFVVRKLVEKFQPQASRSPPFGLYVTEVKKALVEVEVQLQTRELDKAKADLNAALRNVERRAPTDENFEEANTAIVVLQKTLETVHTKDPALAKPVGDARALIEAARYTLNKRKNEVTLQRQRTKIDETRRAAADLVRQIARSDVKDEDIQEAEKAVQQLRTVQEEGAPLAKKDSDYAKYNQEVKERITELNERIANRKITLAATGGRAQLNELIGSAKSKLDTAKQPDSTDAAIEAAVQSVAAVGQALEERAPLEKQDKGYAAQAERGRGELERMTEALDLAKQARDLRRETVEALAAGEAAASAAGSTENLRAQKGHYEKALNLFKACESEGTARVNQNPALASVPVLLDGSRTKVKDVTARCSQRAKETEQLFNQVVPLVQFDEGPKRAFEAGKGLLAKGKKDQALTQFEECISSGLILQNRYPQLKERSFDVAGARMTLPELNQQCIGQRKALRGK